MIVLPVKEAFFKIIWPNDSHMCAVYAPYDGGDAKLFIKPVKMEMYTTYKIAEIQLNLSFNIMMPS